MVKLAVHDKQIGVEADQMISWLEIERKYDGIDMWLPPEEENVSHSFGHASV